MSKESYWKFCRQFVVRLEEKAPYPIHNVYFDFGANYYRGYLYENGFDELSKNNHSSADTEFMVIGDTNNRFITLRKGQSVDPDLMQGWIQENRNDDEEFITEAFLAAVEDIRSELFFYDHETEDALAGLNLADW